MLAPTPSSLQADALAGFKLTRFRDLSVLESGSYWPDLQPFFLKPYFTNLFYRLSGLEKSSTRREEVLSTRGATGMGELDVAYIKDRLATAMMIRDAGLPDYCITAVMKGSLGYTGPGGREMAAMGRSAGLIYRGVPDTVISASDRHERMSIWISAQSLRQCLAGLLGEPVADDLAFAPLIPWSDGPTQGIRRVFSLLIQELNAPFSLARNGIACRAFADLLCRALLHTHAHSYSARLARPAGVPAPRNIRRAEEYIRTNLSEPMALHEVASAAGCSVRSLQLGFRQFRATTPASFMRQARLEAARQALCAGAETLSVTQVAHRFGFTNPGRFAGLYRAAFGLSPANDLRRARTVR